MNDVIATYSFVSTDSAGNNETSCDRESFCGDSGTLEHTNDITNVYALLAIRHIPEPKTFAAAMRCEHAKEWLDAANAEYESHRENGTWTLVSLPPGAKVL